MDESGTCNLADRACVPCRGGMPPLKGEALKDLAARLPDWEVVEDHHLAKTFLFPNFKTALDFVNRVGEVAEREGHHPDLCLSWGRVDAKIHTHKIDGLSESDFILAAKMDRAFAR
jgi:4a-hydroxytetrahydrobiopterin dehydratase